jgi:hypothetical protein
MPPDPVELVAVLLLPPVFPPVVELVPPVDFPPALLALVFPALALLLTVEVDPADVPALRPPSDLAPPPAPALLVLAPLRLPAEAELPLLPVDSPPSLQAKARIGKNVPIILRGERVMFMGLL